MSINPSEDQPTVNLTELEIRYANLVQQLDAAKSIIQEKHKRIEELEAKIKQQDKEYVLNGSIQEWKDYAERTTSKIEKLEAANKELLEGLVELHKESYDLREHCQDRNYIDFNEPDSDGAIQLNEALKKSQNLISKYSK